VPDNIWDLKNYVEKSCRLWLFKWTNDWRFLPFNTIRKSEIITTLVRAIEGYKDENTNP